MKLFEKIKRKVGFTLSEVLMVVAILGVLLAIAIPNIISYTRSVHLTELDDNARAIFMAAQNRMTALVNAGEMDKLLSAEVEETDNPQVVALSATPDDYEGGSDTDLGLYYVTSENTDVMAILLPAGSIESELQSGYYVVEYSYESGAVYSVWYTDEEDYSDFDIQTWPRDKEDRLGKKLLMGYYGGNIVDRPDVGQMPIPEVELINAEELVLRIDIPELENSTLEDGDILMDVTWSSGKKIVEKGYPYVGSKGKIVLDTLKTDYTRSYADASTDMVNGKDWVIGAKFFDWESGIKPGEDFTITVKVYCKDTSKNLLPQIVHVSGNSLFAKVDIDRGEFDDIDAIDDDNVTAYIAYGRHLQNLDHDYSKIDHGNIHAVQIKEINFTATTPEDETDQLEYWAETYVDNGKIKTFMPINYDRVVSYNGNNLPIRNLQVVEIGKAGLFGNLGYETPNANYAYHEGRNELKNIVLINTSATATVTEQVTGSCAGALVAEGVNLDIRNCQVYLEPINGVYPKENIGVSSKTASGGLVGYDKGCVIEDSFASTVVKSDEWAGGLIGQVLEAGSTTIQNSYAASRVTGGLGVGGLISIVTNKDITMTIANCYAAGTLVAGKDGVVPAGLFNFNESANSYTVKNCYVAARYADNVEKAIATFNGDTQNAYIPQSDVTYIDGKKATTETLAESLTDAAWYQSGSDTENPSYAVFPYNIFDIGEDDEEILDPPYPYPMLQAEVEVTESDEVAPVAELKKELMIHHGDWVIEGEEEEPEPDETDEIIMDHYLVYYEKYDAQDPAIQKAPGYNKLAISTENGHKYGYGLYAIDVNGVGDTGDTLVLNTLLMPLPDQEVAAEERIYAVHDGYAVVEKETNKTFTCAINAEEGGTGGGGYVAEKFDFSTAVYVTASYYKGYLYCLPDSVMNSSNRFAHRNGLYERLTVAEGDWSIEPSKNQEGNLVDKSKAGMKENCIAQYYYNSYLAAEAINLYVKGTSGTWRDNNVSAPNKAVHKSGMVYTDKSGKTLDYSNVYIIRTARQLAGISRFTNQNSTVWKTDEFRQTSYEQLLDIDFAKYDEAAIYGGEYGGYTLTGTDDDHALFPIFLNNAKNFYYGHEFVVRGLHLGNHGTSIDVGFIGASNQSQFIGVRLVNTRVIGGSGNTGALVGDYSGDGIDNCGVYVEKDATHTTIDAAYNYYTVKGTGNVGGLAGSIGGDGYIQNSFAAVKVTGSVAGGFVGKGSFSQNRGLLNCYSGGRNVDNPTSEDINVSGSSKAGGFAGEISGKIDGTNYSTCSAYNANGNVGKFTAQTGGNKSGTMYALGQVYTGANCELIPDERYNGNDKGWLKNPAEASDAKAIPYDSSLPKIFPYESKLDTHHGDWPSDGIITNGIYYWEKEGDSYNFYVVYNKASENGPVTVNGKHIASNAGLIEEYGYGYFYLPTSVDAANGVNVTGVKVNDVLANYKDQYKMNDVASEFKKQWGSEYEAIAILSDGLSDYNSLEINKWEFVSNKGNMTVYVNPDFAEAISMEKSTLGTSGNQYRIRSTKQLTHINKSYYLGNTGAGKNFQQTHDIDATTYSDVFEPIGDADVPFTGVYDGNNYFIINVNIESEKRFVGLFGVINNATLQNITLFSTVQDNDKVGGRIVNTFKTDGKTFGIGGLAGAAIGGSIINSAVANYDIVSQVETKSGGAMGGLVGWGDVTITNSSAITKLINETKHDTTNTVRMGGMLGSGRADIKNSYSGGLIKGKDEKSVEYMAGIVADDGLDDLNLSIAPKSSVNNLKVDTCYTYCEFDIKGNAEDNKLYHVANDAYSITNGYFAIHNSNVNNIDFAEGVDKPAGYSPATVQFVHPENENELKTFSNNFKTYANLGSLNGFNQVAVTYKTSITAEPNDSQHKYPFRTIVTRNGNNTHYGDWPDENGFMNMNPYKQSSSGSSNDVSVVVCEVQLNGSDVWVVPKVWIEGEEELGYVAPPSGYSRSNQRMVVLYKGIDSVTVQGAWNQTNTTTGNWNYKNSTIWAEKDYTIMDLSTGWTEAEKITYVTGGKETIAEINTSDWSASINAWYIEDLQGDFFVCAVYTNNNDFLIVPRIAYGDVDKSLLNVNTNGYWGGEGVCILSKDITDVNITNQSRSTKSFVNENQFAGYEIIYFSGWPSSFTLTYSYGGNKYKTTLNKNDGNITTVNYNANIASSTPIISPNDMDSVSEASPSLSDLVMEDESNHEVAKSEESNPNSNDSIPVPDSVDLFVEPDKSKADEIVVEEEEAKPDDAEQADGEGEEDAVDLFTEDENHRPVEEE